MRIFKRKTKIRNKIIFTILLISISTLLYYSRNFMEHTTNSLKTYQRLSMEMGDEINANVSEICVENTEEFLMQLSQKDAEYYDVEFKTIAAQMELFSDELIPSLLTDYEKIDIDEVEYKRMFGRGSVKFADESKLDDTTKKEAYVLALMYNTCFGTVCSRPEIIRMYIATDKDYVVLYSEEEIKDLDTTYYEKEWYKKAVENKDRAVWIEAYKDLITGHEVLTCSKVVCDKYGNFVGVLALDIDTKEMNTQYMNNMLSNGDEIESHILAADGSLVMDCGCGENDCKLSDDIKKIILKEKEGILDDGNHLIAYSEISQTGWIFCKQQDRKVITEEMEIISEKIQDSEKILSDNILYDMIIAIVKMILSSCVIVFILVVVAIYTTKELTKPIYQLISSIRDIKNGNFEKKIEVISSDEIGELANEFNVMLDELNMYIENLTEVTAEKEKIGAELHVATQIQKGMLSDKFDICSAVDINAIMNPAKEVGGDFYDFFMVDQNHFALVVADVSGKGIPAALFMARSMTVIRMLTKPGVLLSEVFEKANNYLCENNQEGLFVTAFEAILDIRTGKMEYVNAGHEKPFIRDKSGNYSVIEVEPGFVLGAIEDIEYNTGTIQMEPGDRFIEYTDGVAEATNVNNELFGEKRLEECLNNNSGEDVRSILQAILQDIDKFTMGADQFDDITILAMEYKNKVTRHSLQVEASLEKYEEVQRFVLDNLIGVELTEAELADLNIMIEEIFVNIASYAYKAMDIPDSEKTVEIILERLGEGTIKIQFADSGIEFNPLMKNDPDINADYNDRGIGGLGIYMVKKSMDNVEYIREGTQNVLTVTNTYKMQDR